ncbi:MAG: transglutaminase family protein [Candidatus Heimdallarchaeota archaeon]|nr:transglutaminase family protein [Candidatus Heimdallarchaeota archaeon]
MENYLQETQFMNYSDPIIQEIIKDLDLDGLTEVEKAIKIFYYVRDKAKYSIKGISLNPEHFKASRTLQKDSSYCIPKAIALSTLARAAGIPSRLHIVDFINHRLAPELVELWGTNVMASHTYSELYIEGRWIKLTPALDKFTCETHQFKLVDFDGTHDALLHEEDLNGHKHCEYINDHGTFDDLPLLKVMQIFQENYGDMAPELIDKFFKADVDTFQ